jgi:hypothetical protein
MINSMTLLEIESAITAHMPLDEFLRIHDRLAWLRGQEDERLKALAELQKGYVAAITDQQREKIKNMVGQIREISRKMREEIRALNTIVHQHMPLAEAKQLYEQYLVLKKQ